MDTPICDFVKNYIKKGYSRFHMPGHKGKGGFYKYDVTEINGADVLYNSDGIIEASRQNATKLFESFATFYSTEGSSLSIKAMVGAVCDGVTEPLILAGRNSHKAFIYACALLNVEVSWLYPKSSGHLTECAITPDVLQNNLKNAPRLPTAVYLTSPDYLGNTLDIKGLSEVCKSFNIPLLIDNAHGAYLKFLTPSMHPISLGATMCVDSAHKTLPVLTGGGYLHIAKNGAKYLEAVKRLLPTFASTSPSYLILQSLDRANLILSKNFTKKINKTIAKLNAIKTVLAKNGVSFIDDEPLKLSVAVAKNGYTYTDFCDLLRKFNIEAEFIDCDYAVFMVSPFNGGLDFLRLKLALSTIKPKAQIKDTPVNLTVGERKLSVKDAVFSKQIVVNVDESLGKICASVTVSCPPAVPIVICGEVITQTHISLFKRYGIKTVSVVVD